ncbi:hypothetical protein BD414DRAFT_451072 [Trametes punicea]|nr:hypothetical protein BD414DRAFT_451072 [Trametes punicea]
MLRWTLQTVRVVGGCADVRQVFRSISNDHCTSRPLTGSSPRPFPPPRRGLPPLLPLCAGHITMSSSIDLHVAESLDESGPETVTGVKTTIHQGTTTADGVAVHHIERPADPSAFSTERIHASSLERLRSFLHDHSLDDPMSPYSARQIRHRYLLWKREGSLRHLSSHDMSSLISFFGTLSMSTPGKPYKSIYAHRRLPDMPEVSFCPHWHLVLGICRDKQWLRYPLLQSDLYWLMRARLVRFWEHVRCNDKGEAERLLSAAKRCYDAICDSSLHPDVHLPYLQALRSLPSPEHVADFAVHVGAIFVRSRRVHWSIRDFFYNSVLSLPTMDQRSKQEILSSIAERVANEGAGISLANDAKSPMDFEHREIGILPSPWTDARGLVASLEHVTFGGVWNGQWLRASADSQILRWACALAARVFSTARDFDAPSDLQWNCLSLLALVRTRSTEWTGRNAESASDPVQRAAIMEWQTVCVLAAMENLLHSSAGDAMALEVVQGFCGVLRRLWHDWTTISPSAAPPRPLYVSRTICASFLKLAGHLKDKSLVDGCREYTVSANLWTFKESDPLTAAGLQTLANEQLYAALVCGTFFERALVDLVVCTSDMDLLRGAVDTAVLRYARSDPEHAQELLSWARHRGIAPSSKAITYVGVALVRHGDSSHIERYISHPRLSPEERAQVVIAHLRMFVAYGRRFLEPRTVMDVSPSIISLLGEVTDLKPLLKSLWSALLILIREGYAARVLSFVKDIAAQHPAALLKSDYTELLGALLRHRRLKVAERLLAHSALIHPDLASHWKTMAFLRFAGSRANRLASKLAKSTAVKGPVLRAVLALSRAVRSRRRTNVSTLCLAATYGRASDPAVACRAIHLLVRAGRTQAAKKLYEQVCRQESEGVRTAAGNMILHGTAHRAPRSRSRGQRVRTIAYVYKTLVDRYGFVPDRVTVNILLKTLLLSKTLDAAETRAMFDAVLAIGYPSGPAPTGQVEGNDRARSSGVFSTKSKALLSVGGVEIPQLSSPLMYARHVRPLYKTFVKAFHLLGDVQAARKVVGILKNLEASNMKRLVKGKDWVVGS